MTKHTLVGGEVLANVHDPSQCEGEACCIHNPSDHHMIDWPQHWRGDRGIMERICPHGVGHPDPDDLDFIARTRGIDAAYDEGVHGCCADNAGRPCCEPR